MSRPRSLNDIQRADVRRRLAAGEKGLAIAHDFGVSLATIRRAGVAPKESDTDQFGTAVRIAAMAADLFDLTLEEIQRSPGRGHPSAASVLHLARTAAVAAMRGRARPVAWGTITEVLAPGAGRFGRLNLQAALRRARATGRAAA